MVNFSTLFGALGDSGEIRLSQSRTHKDKFERNYTDEFLAESDDLGELVHVRIGHDGSGLGSDWFLDSVEVIEVTSQTKFGRVTINFVIALETGLNDNCQSILVSSGIVSDLSPLKVFSTLYSLSRFVSTIKH